MDIAVIGAGISGLTTAYYVSNFARVTVYEKQTYIGGLGAEIRSFGASGEKYNIFFSRTDKAVFSILEELGLEDLLVWNKVKQAVLVKTKLYSAGTPESLLKFPGLNLQDKAALIKFALRMKAIKNPKKLVDQKIPKWLKQSSSVAVYEKFFLPLLYYKFKEFDDVSAAYMLARFMENKQDEIGSLKGGLKVLLDETQERIFKAKGKMLLSQMVTSIKLQSDGKWAVFSPQGTRIFDAVVSTLPITDTGLLYSKLKESIPGLEDIKYLSVGCLRLTLKRCLSKNRYWLYMSDWDQYEKTRVIVDSSAINSNNIIYFPRYYRKEIIPQTEIRKEAIIALKQINSNFDENWIEQELFFEDQNVEPVLTPEFLKLRTQVSEDFNGLYVNESVSIEEMLKTINTAIIKSKTIAKRIKKKYARNSSS